jgi:hypothetical protein
VHLKTLGKLELEGLSSDKLSSQLLLVLSYMCLEGETSKTHIARLFWPHLSQVFSKRGERKDLNNVSVALATLRREAGLELETIADLKCDAVALLSAFESGDYQQVLELYQPKGFLADIETKPRLKLSAELYDWVLQQRSVLAELAFKAALYLAQDNLAQKSLAGQKPVTNNAYGVFAKNLWQDSFGPQAFSKLYNLAKASEELDPQLEQLRLKLSQHYLDELPEDMLLFYLLLSLQTVANLSAARISANLSPKQAVLYQQELIAAGHLSERFELTTRPLAEAYLSQDLSLQLDLLTRLLRQTPSHESYELFQQLYRLSDSFGGMGYWSKAQEAYSYEAEKYLRQQDFAACIQVLEVFIGVETRQQQTPEPYIHFLHAYTLARLSRYAEGLQTLQGVIETLEVSAIKAGLLLATGDKLASEPLARAVLENPKQSRQTDWAKAIAANTLGSISHFKKRLQEAEHYMAQAALHFELAGMNYRALGMLHNRAVLLIDMVELSKAEAILKDVLAKSENHTLLRVRSLESLGFVRLLQKDNLGALPYFEKAYQLAKEDNFAKTHVGLYASSLSIWSIMAFAAGKLSASEAEASLQEACLLCQQSGYRREHSKALVHLALVQQDVAAFESAWQLLKQLAGIQEWAIYQPAYKALLEGKMAQARASKNQEAYGFYNEKYTAASKSI